MCTTFERKNDIGQAFHSRFYMNISNPPIYIKLYKTEVKISINLSVIFCPSFVDYFIEPVRDACMPKI